MNEGLMVLLWFLVPFVIGTLFHFAGCWLGLPALLVGGMYWFGLCIKLKESARD